MARLSSDLVLTLHDKVSGPARGIDGALNRIDRRQRSVSDSMRSSTRLTAQAAAGMARTAVVLAPAALAYGAKEAFTRFAAVERSINRIGITAGATAEQTKAAFGVIDKAAFDYAMSQDQIVTGLDAMVAAGRSMPSALSFLPAVAATAQAAGAEVTDIATTADALGNSFGITGDKMQGAFDILVAAGKAGKFELKDMAKYVPTLGPAFEALGYKGEYGIKKLAAALQIVRQRTGSSEEAATSFANVLQKMETEETAKKFAKFGIDLRKEMAKARDEGKDLLDVFIDLSTKALDGDMSKLPQLFGDAQVISGMRALIAGGDDLGAMFGRLGDAAGETRKDLNQVLGDSQAKIDRMSASWDKLVKTVGGGVATAANPVLDAINSEMDDLQALQAGVDKAKAPGESLGDVQRAYFDAYKDLHPDTSALDAWDPTSEARIAGRQAMMDLGRGKTKTLFDELNRQRSGQQTQRFPSSADGQAASDAHIARNAGNIDGGEVQKNGTPVPRSRDAPIVPGPAAMSDKEQRRQYDAGRRLGEKAAGDALSPATYDINRDPGALAPSADYVALKQRKQRARQEAASAAAAAADAASREAEAARLAPEAEAIRARIGRETGAAAGRSFTPMVDSRVSILERRLADIEAAGPLPAKQPAPTQRTAMDLIGPQQPAEAAHVQASSTPAAFTGTPTPLVAAPEADAVRARNSIEEVASAGHSFAPMVDSRVSILERRQAYIEAAGPLPAKQPAPTQRTAMDLIGPQQPAEAAHLQVPSTPAAFTGTQAPLVAAREADTSSMEAMARQFAALLDRAGSFQPAVTGTDVRDEAGVAVDTAAMDVAKMKAAETGAAIQTSLAVTATPNVVTTSISAARREVDALVSSLQRIPGLAAAASSAAAGAASAGTARVDYDGLHADLNQ